ncbi:MAG: hypothetical protein ACOYOE_07680 [Chlorobium sp.]
MPQPDQRSSYSIPEKRAIPILCWVDLTVREDEVVLFSDTKCTLPQKALARFRNQRIGILFLFHHFFRISQSGINSVGERQYTFTAEENS